MDALRAQFKPEFLNRVDDVIIYHAAAGESSSDRIVEIQLEPGPQAARPSAGSNSS